MHLVIGAGEFLGDAVSQALAPEVPLIELRADSDVETLTDAMQGVDVVHVCAEAWLKSEANDMEVVVVRPARVFGPGEDFVTPHLIGGLGTHRLWLPGAG